MQQGQWHVEFGRKQIVQKFFHRRQSPAEDKDPEKNPGDHAFHGGARVDGCRWRCSGAGTALAACSSAGCQKRMSNTSDPIETNAAAMPAAGQGP